jgi:hypothetical protein
MNQGCVNEGTDTRTFGKWGCTIQRWLSFHSQTEPLSVLVCFPPFIAVNVPLPGGRYLILRAGFRYDKNWPGYIFPESAAKVKGQTIFY